jgi:hypothetical protein
MVTVPADTILDQLTLYVRVSPRWNARVPAGNGTIVCSAAPDREAANKSPGTRKQNITNVRKNQLDPVFKRRVIWLESIVTSDLQAARTKPEVHLFTYSIEYFTSRSLFIT